MMKKHENGPNRRWMTGSLEQQVKFPLKKQRAIQVGRLDWELPLDDTFHQSSKSSSLDSSNHSNKCGRASGENLTLYDTCSLSSVAVMVILVVAQR